MRQILLPLFLVFAHSLCAQTPTDSLAVQPLKVNYKAFVVPGILLGYGIVGLESHALKSLNSDIKQELNEHIDERLSIDDFSQYSPFVSVYVLNACGLKGKHRFGDRSLILATAYLIMGTTVNSVKLTGREERPDQSSLNSFPSGHTATAFMGAEFLYQEYKHISVWYGAAGYLVASATGYFRMYNNRHWLNDVAAGAGIGILSTKAAYYLHPVLKSVFSGKKPKQSAMLMPFYHQNSIGLGIVAKF